MKRLAWPSALLGVALVAAACSSSGSNGLSGDSPTQVLNAVKHALASATSATITGKIESSGKQATFNLTTFSNGDFQGTISENGATVKLVRIGNTDYLNASQSFYESEGASAQAAGAIAGKWVYGADSQIGVGNSFTLSSLAEQITKPSGTVTKGSTGTIDGQPTLALHSPQGTLWVATSGTAYPIEEIKTGSNGGVVQFTAWNQGTTPVAPSGARSLSSIS